MHLLKCNLTIRNAYEINMLKLTEHYAMKAYGGAGV
jgi:hypothetical protein